MRCPCCSAKPSDAAARKLLHKVGGTLEEAMQATELDWRGKGLDDDDANVVAHVVMANGALTTLILGSLFGGNNIGGEGAIAIAEALKVHGLKLTYLRLDGNRSFGNEGAKAMGKALRVNAGVRTLKLNDTQIGDAGAVAMANALRVNGALTRLELDSNQIGDTGAAAIAGQRRDDGAQHGRQQDRRHRRRRHRGGAPRQLRAGEFESGRQSLLT
jgi:hypothetical protein